jgi:hypothetical protein
MITDSILLQALEINILGVNSFGADPSIELRPQINIEYKYVQLVVSSESDIEVPADLIHELQSSGHITEVKCNKSSGTIVLMTYNIMCT